MKRFRLLAIGCLGMAAVVLAIQIKRAGGIDGAGFPLLVLLDVVAGIFAAAVVVDTLWHAFKGQGQACRHCGHLRHMSSFRVYGNCPNCGE